MPNTKTKKMDIQGTEVELGQSKEKLTQVHITTTDADIYVNGVCIWTANEDENMKFVPPVLRSFFRDKMSNSEIMDKSYAFDVVVAGQEATFYVSKNARKPISVRIDYHFGLDLVESEYIRNYCDIDEKTADGYMEELRQMERELFDVVEKAGWRFRMSHGSGEGFHAWWDVIFNLEDWDADTLTEIVKKSEIIYHRIDKMLPL